MESGAAWALAWALEGWDAVERDAEAWALAQAAGEKVSGGESGRAAEWPEVAPGGARDRAQARGPEVDSERRGYPAEGAARRREPKEILAESAEQVAPGLSDPWEQSAGPQGGLDRRAAAAYPSPRNRSRWLPE